MISMKTPILAALLGMAALSAQADIILPPGASWEYRFTDPTASQPSWNTQVGTGSGWSTGNAPFGNAGGEFGPGTYWPADCWGCWDGDVWLRRNLDLTGWNLNTITFGLGVDNGFSLYVNGTLVSSGNAEGYTYRWEYAGGIPAGLLNQGNNVLAVVLEDHGGLTAFDMQIEGTPLPPVPEPGTYALMGIGLLGLAYARKRARKS